MWRMVANKVQAQGFGIMVIARFLGHFAKFVLQIQGLLIECLRGQHQFSQFPKTICIVHVNQYISDVLM